MRCSEKPLRGSEGRNCSLPVGGESCLVILQNVRAGRERCPPEASGGDKEASAIHPLLSLSNGLESAYNKGGHKVYPFLIARE